ncbi:MAG TPA: hypothetical protein VE669_10680 [Actinomycetota bacterium]|nr:hypothetical protein [Actinomycetota bacterium]
MRGPIRVLVSLGLVLSVAAPAVPATADHRPGPCALDRTEDEGVRHWVRRLIRCAADEWPVPGGARRAICIARAESHLNPKATSADGTYVGLYQHAADAWPDRYEAWTKRRWKLDDRPGNGRTNTIVTIRMVNANGWGPWRGVDGC